MVQLSPRGNGFEAWRLLHGRYSLSRSLEHIQAMNRLLVHEYREDCLEDDLVEFIARLNDYTRVSDEPLKDSVVIALFINRTKGALHEHLVHRSDSFSTFDQALNAAGVFLQYHCAKLGSGPFGYDTQRLFRLIAVLQDCYSPPRHEDLSSGGKRLMISSDCERGSCECAIEEIEEKLEKETHVKKRKKKRRIAEEREKIEGTRIIYRNQGIEQVIAKEFTEKPEDDLSTACTSDENEETNCGHSVEHCIECSLHHCEVEIEETGMIEKTEEEVTVEDREFEKGEDFKDETPEIACELCEHRIVDIFCHWSEESLLVSRPSARDTHCSANDCPRTSDRCQSCSSLVIVSFTVFIRVLFEV